MCVVRLPARVVLGSNLLNPLRLPRPVRLGGRLPRTEDHHKGELIINWHCIKCRKILSQSNREALVQILPGAKRHE